MSISGIVQLVYIFYFIVLFAVGVISSIDYIRSYPGLSHEVRSIIVAAILFFSVGISTIPFIFIGHIALALFCTKLQKIKKNEL